MTIGPGDSQEAVDARRIQHDIYVAEKKAEDADRVEARKCPPVPSGTTIAALRAELTRLQDCLVAAGHLDAE